MRWKHIDKDPEEGAIRIRRKFLLLPKCINDEWHWLERATWKEEYIWCTCYVGIHGLVWIPVRWVN